MSKRQWYSIEIFNGITQRWELVMKVKSPGLAHRAISMLTELYGNENVRKAE